MRVHKGKLFTGENLILSDNDSSIRISRKKIFSGKNPIYVVYRRVPDTRRKLPVSKITTGKFIWMYKSNIFAEEKVDKIYHAYVYSALEPEKLPEGKYVVIFKSDDGKITEITDFIVMSPSLGEQRIEQIILFSLTEKSPMTRQELIEKVMEGLK